MIRIRVSPEVATPQYIVAYLNSSFGKRKIAEVTIQATRARFALGQFKKLEVDLPSLQTQERFSEGIAHIDDLRTKQRESELGLLAVFASLQQRAFWGKL